MASGVRFVDKSPRGAGHLVRVGARKETEDVLDENIPHDLDGDFCDNEPDYDHFQLCVVLVCQLLA